MTIQANDPFGGLLILALLIVVLWVIAYSATRVAIGGTRDAVFAASFVPHPDRVHLTVANVGLGAAFRVVVVWADAPNGAPLATAEFVGPLVPFEVDLPVAAIPEEGSESRVLMIQWRMGTEPLAHYRSSRCSALVPARLLASAPGIEPSGPAVGGG